MIALLQSDLVVLEPLDADLGSLQVRQDTDLPAEAPGPLAGEMGAAQMVLAVPWEKLSRTTSTPPWMMASITWGSSVDGPRVATIFVLRSIKRAP